jgi:hypothetical protein
MRATIALLLALTLISGCALRTVSIGDLQRDAVRYTDRTVRIEGTVTNSWGVPLVPFRFYRIQDDTGELTVLSNGSRSPVNGSRVRVKGVVRNVATVGGQSVGLHLAEESLDIKR